MTYPMELASLVAAFFVIFIVGSAAVCTSSNDGDRLYRAAAGFVTVSAFFQVAIMFAGMLGANFPGTLIGLWIIWSLTLLVWPRGRQTPNLKERLQTLFLRVLRALEVRNFHRSGFRLPPISRTFAILGAIVAATFMQRAWYPLHNLHFSQIETYSRTLDLQKFAHRDSFIADGAAYILEPLGVFSGLYPDSVVRFSGPLFSVLLVLAVAFCAFRFMRTAEAALVAAACMAVWPVIVGNGYAGEISTADLAAVYWVLGAGFVGRSWRLTLYAFASALLTSFHLSSMLPVAAASIAIAFLFVRLLRMIPERFRVMPIGALAGLVVLLLLASCGPAETQGAFEYEAAARACRSIASQFPRNQWLVISPVQELAFTYGRGWHFELLDFVSNHTIGQISPGEFSFPYNVKDIFVFVEKRPLQGKTTDGSLDLTQTMDRAVLAYHTGHGRDSIEFQAGALLAAYGTNHRNMSIFYEDDHFVVFHIHKDPDAQLLAAQRKDGRS